MSDTASTIGLADPVHDAQGIFRTVLEAMSRPGSVQPFAVEIAGAPFVPSAAAVLLTLADHETTAWLDPGLAAGGEVAAYLRFATGTRITTDPREATFALVADPAAMPALDAFAQGTPEYPDRSTTLVLIVDRINPEAGDITISGPGIKGTASLGFTPSPPDLASQLEANRARFPMGVDLILCAPDAIAALPRSIRLVGAR